MVVAHRSTIANRHTAKEALKTAGALNFQSPIDNNSNLCDDLLDSKKGGCGQYAL
jgi:hypothetical protein